MKLTNTTLKKIILEVLKEEEPRKEPAQQPPASDGGDATKKLKIDIPDSPFNPDIKQITDQLVNILKQWEVKKYPSDQIRWKEYYKDISKLVGKIKGDIS